MNGDQGRLRKTGREELVGRVEKGSPDTLTGIDNKKEEGRTARLAAYGKVEGVRCAAAVKGLNTEVLASHLQPLLQPVEHGQPFQLGLVLRLLPHRLLLPVECDGRKQTGELGWGGGGINTPTTDRVVV